MIPRTVLRHVTPPKRDARSDYWGDLLPCMQHNSAATINAEIIEFPRHKKGDPQVALFICPAFTPR